jgi:hypothetical protein
MSSLIPEAGRRPKNLPSFAQWFSPSFTAITASSGRGPESSLYGTVAGVIPEEHVTTAAHANTILARRAKEDADRDRWTATLLPWPW